MKEAVGRVDRNVLADFKMSRFESNVIHKLIHSLEDSAQAPILTNDEDDLLIDSDAVYFSAITRAFTPIHASELVKSGELANSEVERRQRAGRAITRQAKSDMYIERAMTATYATDVCRSYYRYIRSGEYDPIYTLETPEEAHVWTYDYIDELFQAGRDRRLLRGAAIVTTIRRVMDRFEFGGDKAAMLTLTAMAGMNTRKKIDFWIDNLHVVSRGFERVTKTTERKLIEFISTRPESYFLEPDLYQLIANCAIKNA